MVQSQVLKRDRPVFLLRPLGMSTGNRLLDYPSGNQTSIRIQGDYLACDNILVFPCCLQFCNERCFSAKLISGYQNALYIKSAPGNWSGINLGA